MLTMAYLNKIKHNEAKFKRINYGPSTSIHFLDKASFPLEDELNDFEFGQAHTNWLTLIEVVSDPIIEKGWHDHHKRMLED